MTDDPLHRLLRGLFSPEELRRFLSTLSSGEELVASLPLYGATTDDIVSAALAVLRRHGLVDVELFLRLMDVRPQRAQEIREVAGAYGIAVPLSEELRVLLGRHFDATAGARLIAAAAQHDRSHLVEPSLSLAELSACAGDGEDARGERAPILSRIAALTADLEARPTAAPVPREPASRRVTAILDEIATLVQRNDGEQAALRLLDLGQLQGRPRPELHRLILLSARVRAWREHHKSLSDTGPSLRDEWIELLREVLTTADEIASTPALPRVKSLFAGDGRRRRGRLHGGREPLVPVLVARDLVRSFPRGDFHLHGVDLELCAGTIVGIVGPNGAGKTTLLRIVAGELAPDSGSIAYPALARPGAADRTVDWLHVRLQIGYVAQRPEPWHGSMFENMLAWAARHGLRGSESLHEVEFLLHRLGLDRFRQAGWAELSAGYQTRFELARVLLAAPRLLVLDEPLAPLDVQAQHRFLSDLRDIASSSQQQPAVLISTQHVHEVEEIADGMVCLRSGGSVEFSGSPAALRTPDERVHELGGEFPAEVWDTLVDRFGEAQVRRDGSVAVVHTLAPHDIAALAGLIASAGGTLRYARDITASTLRLLRKGSA